MEFADDRGQRLADVGELGQPFLSDEPVEGQGAERESLRSATVGSGAVRIAAHELQAAGKLAQELGDVGGIGLRRR
jgi:hypothetical protein